MADVCLSTHCISHKIHCNIILLSMYVVAINFCYLTLCADIAGGKEAEGV